VAEIARLSLDNNNIKKERERERVVSRVRVK